MIGKPDDLLNLLRGETPHSTTHRDRPDTVRDQQVCASAAAGSPQTRNQPPSLVAYPALGIYQTSKWDLEAMSESLAAEVAVYGIHVTLIEPVMFPTGLATASPQAQQDPAHAHARQALHAGAGA